MGVLNNITPGVTSDFLYVKIIGTNVQMFLYNGHSVTIGVKQGIIQLACLHSI